MKISLNWLKDYLDINLPAEQIGEILTDIGLEVEGMEEVDSVKGGLEGIVIGEVKTCGKHPNADRLSLTTVDIGREEGLLQIICGAPNVAAGQKVLVAPTGTTVHPTNGDPFLIKKGKIRGEVSEGMICSEDEIGLGNNHDGILVLPAEAKVGTLGRDFLKIEKDYVYDIGLTPNRSDATNHIGVAKDIAAALKINYEHAGTLRLPSVDDFKVDNQDLPVEVIVENTEACPRYAGVSIKGVTIKESPDWLKKRLQAIDVRPISNIVDITNFVLHEFGQPLHAFDLDEISQQKVIVKTLPQDAPFMSLDEIERKLNDHDLMICDGESHGMCIGGVFGGIKSGVKDGTANIFLESAHFNAKWIRRTSMRHNLRTDAAKVFEKGSDPNVSVYALKRAAMLIKELAGGEIASEIVDIYPNPIQPQEVEVSYAHVSRLIGVDIPQAEIRAILEAMEMEILSETDTHFRVAVPTNKADVTREADVIEEILRIYGFNNVPVPGHIKTAVTIAPSPDPNELKDAIGNLLSAIGFNEMMAVSLTESRYFREILPVAKEELVFVNNTSNIHLDVMRPTMLFSGLEAVLYNQNRQQASLKLFEFGKSYRNKEAGIDERSHLSLLLSGQQLPESWLNEDKAQVDYFTLKAYVQQVLGRLGLDGYQETAITDEVYSFGLRYHRGQQVLVEFGKVHPKLTKKMDIKSNVYYADFNWDAMLKSRKKHNILFEEINKFPSTRRDLALVVENSVKFQDIVAIARKIGKKLIKDINLFDVYQNEAQLGAGKKSYAVSFIFEDSTKTLKDKEVDKVTTRLIQEYEAKLSAVIRR